MRKLTLTSLVLIGLLVGTSHADEHFEDGSTRFEAKLNAQIDRQLSDFVDGQLDEISTVFERREAYAMRHPAAPDPSSRMRCAVPANRVMECTVIAGAIEQDQFPAHR